MRMTAETPPDRRPLATFLHGPQAEAGNTAAATDDTPAPATDETGGMTGDETGTITDAALTDDAIAIEATVTPEPEPAPPPATTITTPTFLRGARPAVRTPRWQWRLVAALGVLLLVQIAVADRARLASDARTRPLIGAVCTVLRCALPAWHEPAAYTMLQREVRPLAGQPGVLQVQASFRNDARWAQAWPALRLSLSDADGRVIGRRTLPPGDYLDPAQGPRQLLEPGQSAQVAFLLREPSAATVAYTFEFR
ncbi:conserved hypothetical protein [uncultured Stenotrophomonas sp.]|uniref:DUF3426 domain-containing protein n=1 Tax=uncultured Stenotrophomonas sp. TaxID=165438 RepID=A0A1Y5Q7V9_9GAMM|nr:conserved hypothetical protein [uncultured Stenotrophomonas sp.]